MPSSRFVFGLGENLGQSVGDGKLIPSSSNLMIPTLTMGILASNNVLGGHLFLLARMGATLFLAVIINLGLVLQPPYYGGSFSFGGG